MELEREGDPLSCAFAPLIGLPAWNVRKGHGSFLTMEFGQPYLSIREPTVSRSSSERVRARLAQRIVKPVGDWHLWIYGCHWRAFSRGTQIGWSESPDAEIHRAMNEIEGQKLTSVTANPDTGTSVFQFDLGASLHTWPWDDEKNVEQWLLYARCGNVFEYRGDGSYSLGPGNQADDKRIWLHLKPTDPQP